MARQKTDDKIGAEDRTEDKVEAGPGDERVNAAPGVNGGQSVAIYRVPATADDMKPPKPSSLITEAANFLRAHWDEVRPFYLAISGESPSLHGACWLDEAACVFEVKRIAKENGFAFLGSIPTNQLRRALRFGFKRNTGTPMWQLEAQYKRLQITHRQQP